MKVDKYQKEIADEMLRKRRGIINLTMGMGKTRTFLAYVKLAWKHLGFVTPVVVLCPKSVVKQWDAAIQEFFGDCQDIFVISQHSAYKYPDVIKSAQIICIDEPKLLKSNTNFARFILGMDLNLIKFGIFLLDATIIENSEDDLTNLCRLFNTSVARLGDFVFPKVQPPAPRKRKIRTIRIPLTCKRKIKQERFLELELAQTLLPHPRNRNRVYKAVGELKMFYLDFEKGVGRQKLDVLIEILRSRHEQDSGVVFVTFKSAMDEIVRSLDRAFPGRVVSFHGGISAKRREEIRLQFNGGKINWIVATRAGERGLDLPAGRVIFNFDFPWSGGSYRQRDRVTRRSSDPTKSTVIYNLAFAESAEELILQKVYGKIQKDKDFVEGKRQKVFVDSWTEFLCNKWKDRYDLDLRKMMEE